MIRTSLGRQPLSPRAHCTDENASRCLEAIQKLNRNDCEPLSNLQHPEHVMLLLALVPVLRLELFQLRDHGTLQSIKSVRSPLSLPLSILLRP